MKKQSKQSPISPTRRRVIATVAAAPALLLPTSAVQAVASTGGANLAPIMITPPTIRVWRSA